MTTLTDPQKRWIKALRSGQYKQGKHQLHSGDKFCCLGVACDLFKEELELDTREAEMLGCEEKCTVYDSEWTVLPDVVQEHLDLKTIDGSPTLSEEDTFSLVSLNDGGMSFSQIADRLETGDYFLSQEETNV